MTTSSSPELPLLALQALLAHAPIILFAYDRNGIVTLSEGRGLEGLGFRPKEVVGRSVFEMYANDPSRLDRARRALAGEDFVVVVEMGSLVFETTLTPIRGAAGEVEGVIGVSIDITERTRAQKRLLQAERLASMGTLSASIAHEINNPLTYVLANLDRAATRLAGSASDLRADELLGNVSSAYEGAERVRRIVRALQSFARQDDDRVEPTDVHAALERAIDMADNAIRLRARLVRHFGATSHALANDLRLTQVFLNLLLNAAQAIPEGNVDANEIRVRTSYDAGCAGVAIEIEDTGSGMPPEVQARIFEPFFTTKPPGVGTGLGLSICHGIVEGFAGRIEVQSTMGRGSIFRVLLKATQESRPKAPAPATANVVAPRRGRVLILDDEENVARSLSFLLTDHDVQIGTDAREALQTILSGARFDVILCDLMMPNMSGMEFHRALVPAIPDQAERIVFMTGGAFTPAAREFVGKVKNTVLEKPYDLAALRSAIARYL